MAVDPIPEGYPRVTPYLSVDGAADAISFYTSVLGATERMRMPGPDGKIAHAELEIGASMIMLADASTETGPDPKQLGGSPVGVMVYMPDVDATYRAAIDAGAESTMEPADQFYGDRMCGFTDPFGHKWFVASHVEDVPPEEMEKRMAELFGA